MAANTSQYENQARLSVFLAVVAGLASIAAALLLFRNYKADVGQIVYLAGGKFILIFGGAILVALLAAAAGFLLGFNSAGQKRNTKPQLSWTGFFLNAAMMTLGLSIFVVFFVLRFELKPT